ncbi:MAG: PLP-dependent aspartate aminotransferase family protein [Gemmatimonadota bacterium]
MRIETIAVHAGHRVDPSTGAVAPPLVLSTTFEHAPDGVASHGFIYSRSKNPNRLDLEESLTALEGGAGTAAFASGLAATMAVFQSLAPGDRVVAPTDAYYGTGAMLRDVFASWGLETVFADLADAAAAERAILPGTRLVWIETPSNPLLKITDITRLAELAHRAGAVLACDNTWPTPLLQRPLDLGADLSIHSTTKYLGGHSDVTGGAVVSRKQDAMFERIVMMQSRGGAAPSPFDCWLIQRGIRSLPYRMRGHCENAARIAAFLATHPRVAAVHYPGLPSHPGHEVARRQMSGFGGMLSIQVKGGRDAAMAVTGRVRLFTCATSLGATESLIEHRASVETPGSGTPEDLLRLSIGLEHPDDLIEDLTQALG